MCRRSSIFFFSNRSLHTRYWRDWSSDVCSSDLVERLTTLDASFLYLERSDSPMHVAGVLVLEPPAGGLEALVTLVEARLALVPRYRQRVLEVPGQDRKSVVWGKRVDLGGRRVI